MTPIRPRQGEPPGGGRGSTARAVRLAVLLATAAAAPGLVLLPAGTASADDGQWSVLPAANTVGRRPYFYLAAAPGQSVADAVTVTNRTDRPRTFRLYAADAHNTVRDGGFALRGPDEPRRAAAAWTKLDRERVTVPAGGTVRVGFTLAVPDRAEPGTTPAPSWPSKNDPPPRPPTPGGSGCSRPSRPGCTCG